MHKPIILLLLLYAFPFTSIANTDDNDSNCISVLNYFAKRIEDSKSSTSPKLPNAIIGKINLDRILSGKKAIESIEPYSYSNIGLKSCISAGVKTPTLMMIVNATEGKQYKVPIEAYEKCGEGMFAFAILYEKIAGSKKGSEMGSEIGFQLGYVEKELRALYPVFDKKVDYSLVDTITKNIKNHGNITTSTIKTLLTSCKTTGLKYKPYLDKVIKQKVKNQTI